MASHILYNASTLLLALLFRSWYDAAMSKLLITGRQGCGKTTAIKLLERDGFTAFNTDDIADATRLENKVTGETIDWPEGKVDWSTYAWNWQRPVIEELLSRDKDVMLGGVVSNWKDFRSLFDKMFVLIVSTEALAQRLSAHEHESHHLPGEVERILANHDQKQQEFVVAGCIPIDANRPALEVVRNILLIAGIDHPLSNVQ
jgi:broad-specificity NMP kinase